MLRHLTPFKLVWPPALLGLALVCAAYICLGSPGEAMRLDAWVEEGQPIAPMEANQRLPLPLRRLPHPVERLVVAVTCGAGGCRDLMVSHQQKVTLPYRSESDRAFFLVDFSLPLQSPSLALVNNGSRPVLIKQVSYRNYLTARPGLPGYWVLLKGSGGSRVSRAWMLFLMAVALAMQAAALSPTLMRREPERLARNAKFLLAPPLLLLAAAAALHPFGQVLLINAETYLALAGAGPLVALCRNRRFWRMAAGWVESGRAHLLPLAWSALTAYTVWVLWSQYAAGLFSHGDLTIFNDWLANAVYRGRPFLQTDSGISGLSYSFSPSIILLTPVYWAFQSQFVLPVLGALAVYLSLVPVIRTQRLLLASLAPHPKWRDLLLGLGLFVVLGANLYTRSAAVFVCPAAFFLLPACLCFYFLLRDRPWPVLLAVFAVALGVRQDAGYALAGLFLLVFLVPRQALLKRKRVYLKAGLLVALALAYSIMLTHWIGPVPGVRTWPAGLSDLALDFAAWGRAFGDSAWWELNASFAWLPLFHPAAWFLANLAGLTQFSAPSADIRGLMGHHGDFLLPLFFYASLLGISSLSRWLDTARGWLPSWRTALLMVPLLWLAVGSVFTLGGLSDLAHEERRFSPRGNNYPVEWYSQVPRMLEACPSLLSVAADEHIVTFVPNRYRRLLLANFHKAQAVFLAQGMKTPFLANRSFEEMDFWIRGTGAFRLVRFTPHFKFYVRKKIPCPGLARAKRP